MNQEQIYISYDKLIGVIENSGKNADDSATNYARYIIESTAPTFDNRNGWDHAKNFINNYITEKFLYEHSHSKNKEKYEFVLEYNNNDDRDMHNKLGYGRGEPGSDFYTVIDNKKILIEAKNFGTYNSFIEGANGNGKHYCNRDSELVIAYINDKKQFGICSSDCNIGKRASYISYYIKANLKRYE